MQVLLDAGSARLPLPLLNMVQHGTGDKGRAQQSRVPSRAGRARRVGGWRGALPVLGCHPPRCLRLG